MADADVTVVIPGYNAEEFIGFAIDSALAQRPAPRVIVVDDGSLDRTAEIARTYDGVEVVSQANSGVAAARNTGLRMAVSSKMIFLDADDALLPGAIGALLEGFAAHPGAVMVFGAYHHMDQANAMSEGSLAQPVETRDPGFIGLHVTPSPSQCMYDRVALDEVGGYDVAHRLNEDGDLNLRLCTQGMIASHPAFVSARRTHSGQSTQRPSRLLQTHLEVMRKHFGPGGLHEDPQTLQRAHRRWCLYYGQYMPIEFVRLVMRRKFTELGQFVSAWSLDAPVVAQGMAKGVLRRLTGAHQRHRRTKPVSVAWSPPGSPG